MTATAATEYRKLELESSNDIIRHDARRSDRKYPEAALHARGAGLARVRMGQVMFDAGDFAQAAADWLSAAACFYLATDLERMREAFDRARKLDHEGKIPAERRDIRAALKEREEQIQALHRKLAQSHHDRQVIVGPARTPNPEVLAWLLTKVRELPGSPHLHAEISGQAMALGQRTLATESLAWARRFDPSSPHLASLQASQLFSFGESMKAAQLAREVLAEYPQMDGTRFLLAQALAFRAGPDPSNWNATDWEEAIDVLEPLLRDGAPDTLEKLMATGLIVTLWHGIGNEINYRRALSAFDKLAGSLSDPLTNKCAAQLRQAMPHVFPQPGSNGAYAPTKPDYSAVRGLFGQPNSLTVSA